MSGSLRARRDTGNRLLTAAEFQRLGNVPPEAEWFKNIRNSSTKRAYKYAIKDFMLFTGIKQPEEFRTVTRAHVIAWREALGEADRSRWTDIEWYNHPASDGGAVVAVSVSLRQERRDPQSGEGRETPEE